MPGWRKSSYSFSNGNCAEIAAWRKSAYSKEANCVEVGRAAAVVGVRDSNLGDSSPVLVFPGVAWGRFTAAIRNT